MPDATTPDDFDLLPLEGDDTPFSLELGDQEEFAPAAPDEFAVIDVEATAVEAPGSPLQGVQRLVDDFVVDKARHDVKMQEPGAAMNRAQDLATLTGFEKMTRNEINQRGLGPSIIDLKKRGFSLQQIATQLAVGYEQVKQWWGIYEAQTPGQRQNFATHMTKSSIYDIPSMMERINDKLEGFMERMEFENPQLYLAAIAETRQLVKLVKDCAETMANQRRREEESQAFIDEIRKSDQAECPRCKHPFNTGLAQRILKRITSLKNARGFLS